MPGEVGKNPHPGSLREQMGMREWGSHGPCLSTQTTRREMWMHRPVTEKASPTRASPGEPVPEDRLVRHWECNFYFKHGSSFMGGYCLKRRKLPYHFSWDYSSWVRLYTSVNSFNILQPKAELYLADTRGCTLEVSDCPHFLEVVEYHKQLHAFLL